MSRSRLITLRYCRSVRCQCVRSPGDRTMMKLFLSLLTVLLSARCAQSALTSDFKVEGYNMTFQGSPASVDSMAGKVKITLTCINPTNVINLNWGQNLSPNPALPSTFTIVKQPDAKTDIVTPVTVTGVQVIDQENIRITVGSGFDAGNIVNITAHFMTVVSKDPSNGLHYVQYYYGNTLSYIIAALPWPQKSRQMFPCMDGQEFPAKMNVTLTLPSSWTSGSSFPQRATVVDTNAGTTTVVYNSSTLQIPPSGAAFFIGSNLNAEVISDSRSPTQFSYVVPGGWMPLPLQQTKQYLTDLFCALENHLNMPWPGGILHIVFVPNQPAPVSGYGVIFIRNDSYMQTYNSPQSEGDFKNKLVPIMKEFILLYTRFSSYPASFSHLWVHKAVAGFLLPTFLATFSPFDTKTEMEVEMLQQSLAMDTVGSNPLLEPNIDASSTAVVELALMDPLKDLKGPCLLNMFDLSFPAGSMFNAMKTFLRQFQGKAITTTDFCAQIVDSVTNSGGYVSPDGLKALDASCLWFSTAGSVMMNVSVHATGNPGTINVAMRPFCQTPPCTNTVPAYYASVPVGSRSEPRDFMLRPSAPWVTNTETGVSISIRIADGDWVMDKEKGRHFISNYTVPVWQLLTEAIVRQQNGVYEIMDRSQLIFDAFVHAQGCFMSYNTPLRLITTNIRDQSYRDWFPAYLALARLRDDLWGLPQAAPLKAFMVPFLKEIHSTLESGTLDPYEQAKIYTLFLPLFCDYDTAQYRIQAIGNMTFFLVDQPPTTIPSSAYEATVCCAAKYTSADNTNWYWGNITDATFGYNRKHFNAVALGCYSNYTRITDYYPAMMSADIQLKPHLRTIFRTVADERGDALTANFSTIIVSLTKQVGVAYTARLIERACKKVNTNSRAAYLVGIASADVDNVVKTAATNCIATVKDRAARLLSCNSSMVSALKANKLGPDTPSAAAPVTLLSLTGLLVISLLTSF